MQAPDSFLRGSTLGAARGFGLRLALVLLLLLQQQLAEAVVPPRQHSSPCGFLLAPSGVHFNTRSSSATAAGFFRMGASPSRTASSPSPQQRSGLLGKGVSGSNDDVVGDGYGAAGSSMRLQATAPTGNDLDPEDPSAAAAGLRSGGWFSVAPFHHARTAVLQQSRSNEMASDGHMRVVVLNRVFADWCLFHVRKLRNQSCCSTDVTAVVTAAALVA